MTNEPLAEPQSDRPYRPPIGMPLEPTGRWGTAVSLLLHILLVLLAVSPIFATRALLEAERAGGRGPAGGGGGGRGGRGGAHTVPERLHFFPVAPPQPAVPVPPVPPPKVPVVAPRLVVPKPQPVPPPAPTPPIAPPRVERQVEVEAPPAEVASAPNDGGTGNDGTNGNGPGTGGGKGTGNGTGQGSQDGPGTGGGEGKIFPATPALLLLPPNPIPRKVHGKTFTIRFSIDEKGHTLGVEIATGDGGYDSRVRDYFKDFQFRPAHRSDGTPIASIYAIDVAF